MNKEELLEKLKEMETERFICARQASVGTTAKEVFTAETMLISEIIEMVEELRDGN